MERDFMKTILKKILLYSLNIPLYIIASVTKKDPNLWVIGSWFGDKYSDNSRFLFEYINTNKNDINAVWICKDRALKNKIRAKGYQCYLAYSLKAILIGLRAQYSIFSQSNYTDCMLFMNNKKTKLIQLWHGMPLKKIGFDDDLVEHKNASFLKRLLIPFFDENYDMIIACSEEDGGHFKSAFKNNNIVITGYPRNDVFKPNNMKFDNKYNLVYLPTFRGSVGSEIDMFGDYNFNYNTWREFLQDNEIVLNYKLHPVNKITDENKRKIMSVKNINLIESDDLMDVLPNMNLLITDYSSVYFDFLLTNKPIIFSPFGHEKYLKQDRTLYYDYDNVTPGPKCYDWEDVMFWVEKYMESDIEFKEEREELKNKVHNYKDNKSSERVYNEILKI